MTDPVYISQSEIPSKKYWVKKEDWIKYRHSHHISIFTEYRHAKYISDTPESLIGEADQIAEYKKLLDDGVITKEEFDAKKKQILKL